MGLSWLLTLPCIVNFRLFRHVCAHRPPVVQRGGQVGGQVPGRRVVLKAMLLVGDVHCATLRSEGCRGGGGCSYAGSSERSRKCMCRAVAQSQLDVSRDSRAIRRRGGGGTAARRLRNWGALGAEARAAESPRLAGQRPRAACLAIWQNRCAVHGQTLSTPETT